MQTQYSKATSGSFTSLSAFGKSRMIPYLFNWMPKRIRRHILKKYLLTISLSGPSGSGKSKIIPMLFEKIPNLAFSISATTRRPRGNEKHGSEYYFLTAEEFRKRIDAGEFMEWEEVYPGIYYGTLWCEIERLAKLGKIVIFDVDIKGARKIKKMRKDKHHMIFIHVTPAILEERLPKRGDTPEEDIAERLAKSKFELEAMQHHTPTISNVLNDEGVFASRQLERTVRRFLATA